MLGYIDKFLKNPKEATRNIFRSKELGWEIDPAELRTCIRGLIFDSYAEQLKKTQHEAEATEGMEQE